MGKRADRVHTRCRLIFVACIVRMDVCVGRDVSETVHCCMSVRNRVQRERERQRRKKDKKRQREGESRRERRRVVSQAILSKLLKSVLLSRARGLSRAI